MLKKTGAGYPLIRNFFEYLRLLYQAVAFTHRCMNAFIGLLLFASQ